MACVCVRGHVWPDGDWRENSLCDLVFVVCDGMLVATYLHSELGDLEGVG